MIAHSTLLNDFEQVDFEAMRYPMIVIYNSPKDFPGKFAARIFDVTEPTPYVVVKKSLDELRKVIPLHMVWHQRHKNDDPVIKEIYY